MANNTVAYGLSNVHIAFHNDQATNGFETPIAIEGAVSLSTDAAGDQTEFYADNKPWFTQFKNNGYTGTLEMAILDDAVYARMVGNYVDSNGNIVEDANGTPAKFALLFQVEGDAKARRAVMYDVQASRSGENANTTQASISPDTKTLNITAAPYTFSNIEKNIPMLSCSYGDSSYNDFMSAVVVPAGAADQYEAVTPAGTENPFTEGWYSKVGSVYTPTDDTTVEQGKTYYEKA
jgi:phi13 family phage major tail protein